MGAGIGGGKSSSSSTPVTWEKLLTPGQKQGQAALANPLIKEAMSAFQGYGLTPGEQLRQKSSLTGSLADYAGGMRTGVGNRAAQYGQGGGVVEGAQKNIDASKMMAFGQGLRSIADMNEQAKQQKIANLLSYVTWQPPVSQKSESSGWNMSLAGGK
jgi:hypothetical protein